MRDKLTPDNFSLQAVLANRRLSAVTFVQDYVQLDFDGRRLTLFIWPQLELDGTTFTTENKDYRNGLCGFIGKQLIGATESETQIALIFEHGLISIDLSEEIGMEHVVYEDASSNAWAWW